MTKLQDCAHTVLKALRNRMNRLEDLKVTLKQVLGINRSKRGVLNIIGSLSKTLFGTLGEDDMKIINQEFDKLYSDNRIMAETLSNQTRILKTWLSSTSQDLRSLNELSESRAKELNSIINSTNINQQNLVVGNIITVCSLAVAELNEDLNMLINAINNGKHGIIHPQILTPAVLTSELRQKLKKIRTRNILLNSPYKITNI